MTLELKLRVLVEVSAIGEVNRCDNFSRVTFAAQSQGIAVLMWARLMLPASGRNGIFMGGNEPHVVLSQARRF